MKIIQTQTLIIKEADLNNPNPIIGVPIDYIELEFSITMEMFSNSKIYPAIKGTMRPDCHVFMKTTI